MGWQAGIGLFILTVAAFKHFLREDEGRYSSGVNYSVAFLLVGLCHLLNWWGGLYS